MTTPSNKTARRGPFFFLNPYVDAAFTRCPRCEGKTKVRKVPLVIHVEPHMLCVPNKICRFCPGCPLVIAKKVEIEDLLAAMFEHQGRVIGPEDYLVMGTLAHADWRRARKEYWPSAKTIEHALLFKDQLHFVSQGGWHREK